MTNLVAICAQLVQHKLPVYADEKVYCMAKEIELLRPAEFKNLVLCLGTFHTAKTLLTCTGKSLEGSGAENVWLEAGGVWSNSDSELNYQWRSLQPFTGCPNTLS